MKFVQNIGNVPTPVQHLARIEMGANYTVKKYLAEQEGSVTEITPRQCFPVLVECSSIQELDDLISAETDIDKQLLVDRETGRLYIVALGQVGRMNIKGSGEEDEKLVDAQVVEEDKSVIYYTEVEKNSIEIISSKTQTEDPVDGTGTTGVRDPGGNVD